MIIDNRPKVHRVVKKPAESLQTQAAEAAIHSQNAGVVPDPPLQPEPKAKLVRAKSKHSSPLGGLGKLLGGGGGGGLGKLLGGGSGGGLGKLLGGGGGGGLGSLLGGGSGGPLGGGVGTVLPIVLIASALQQQRPRGPSQPQRVQPISKEELDAIPVTAASASALAVSGGKQDLKSVSRHKAQPKASMPEPAAEPAPAVPAVARPAIPARPAPKPTDIRNLLTDLAGYLPGTGGVQAARIAKVIGLADEMKALNTSGAGEAFAMTQSTGNPLDRHIGVLNALSRNLPIAGADNLGKASQVLTIVNTLRGGSGGGLGNLGNIGNIGNIGNMAGMLRTAMGSQSPSPTPDLKSIAPSQADLKNTVNKLLSGMDDKQKDELLSKAKDFLGKK